MTVCILGIDPGVSGAIALYDPAQPHAIVAIDTPMVGKDLDVDTLVAELQRLAPTFAIIEQVSSMPKQGVASTFKFGTAYGAARAAVIALRIPHTLIVPTKWKRHFNLSSDGELSRALALRLWPGVGVFSRKKDHNRAEAALLARYAADVGLAGSAPASTADRGVAGADGGSPVVGANPTSSPRATGMPA